MSFGSFLQGFAGGFSSGRGVIEARKDRDFLQELREERRMRGQRPDLGDGPAYRDHVSMPERNEAMERHGGPTRRASIDISQDEREILAKTLQAEAGNQGYDGMLAAGAVIRNRAEVGGYGDGIKGVILRPGQFSAWNSVTGYAGGEQGQDMASMRASKNAYAAADAILSGKYSDPTGGATHYYNPSISTPKWGKKRAGGNWTRIGDHIFGFADGNPGRDRRASAPKRQAEPTPEPRPTAEASPTPKPEPQAQPVAEAAGPVRDVGRGVIGVAGEDTAELMKRWFYKGYSDKESS